VIGEPNLKKTTFERSKEYTLRSKEHTFEKQRTYIEKQRTYIEKQRTRPRQERAMHVTTTYETNPIQTMEAKREKRNA
jgi:hypothetical protein